MEHLKFVIVGHVDHGKSTLIGRLFFDTDSLPPEKIEEIKQTCEALGQEMEFAYLMDHLEEERKQGITIDTAQTWFKTDKREYVIIDAPGHKEFIKNMVTGASLAEAAILIVDADEGVREQTRRHAYILSLLGLKQVIVVVNKMDLVEYKQEKFEEVKKETADFLNSINIQPTYFVPISAKGGDFVAKKSDKMTWYNGPTVLEALDTFKTTSADYEKPLRLPVQDVYKIDDKRIIAGRIESGKMILGQDIIILPTNEKTKIKTIEIMDGQKQEAGAGESIGITTEDPSFTDRGHVISEIGKVPKVTDTIKANLFWMSKDPIKSNERITLKCSTQEVICQIEKIEKRLNSSSLEVIATDADKLENNEVGEVIIKTDTPITVENFNNMQELGRFVLERGFDNCAGGIITQI